MKKACVEEGCLILNKKSRNLFFKCFVTCVEEGCLIFIYKKLSLKKYIDMFITCVEGSRAMKKNGKKGDIVPLWRPPPKRVKRGHLLSEKRQ